VKKVVTLFLTLIMLLSLTNCAAASSAKINGSVVNVRSGPGTTYSIAGTLYKDTQVEVLQQSNGWNQIKYGSLTGWVSASLLTPDITLKVTGKYVNLRSGPGTTYSVLGQVKQGDVLTLIDVVDDWYIVKTPGLDKAYITASLVEKASSAAPSVPPTTTPADDVLTVPSAPASGAPRVLLNGQQLKFDVDPIIESGRTLVPLRAIFEAMGATVNWDAAAITVTATKGSTTVILPVGSRVATVNDKNITLDVPARIVGNRTLVPLRFVSESFGAQVDWNSSERLVTITAQANTSTTKSVTIIEDEVNLRSGPATSYDKLGTARSGERLAVLGESNGWYQVSRGGSTVWVAGWLVKAEGEATPTEPVNPEPEPQPTEPEPEPEPEPAKNVIHLARTMDENGFCITIQGGQRLNGESRQENGKLVYEFEDMQLEGLNYFKEDLGSGSAIVRGKNKGNNAVVEIELPASLKYKTATTNNGKTETITVPNYIISVERKTFGSGGERLIITTMAPVKYSGSLKGDQLQVELPNVQLGQAKSSYTYGSSILKKANFKADGTSTLITITTSELGKYSFGQSGEGKNLNILLLGKTESKPKSGIVMLDPGHGGKDNGASGPSGLHEKDVNLSVALKAGQLLEAKGIKVEYSRTDDTYVYLEDISAKANKLNADLFVSIHSNSALNTAACGTETHTFTSIDYPELFMQQDERKRLAQLLQDNLIAKLQRINRGVKESNFAVLRNTKMPAALVEMSFISNPTEEQLLGSDDYQNRAAEAIADAIYAYLN
jgi:N-acetylmuramoyl-L-alanine amidase